MAVLVIGKVDSVPAVGIVVPLYFLLSVGFFDLIACAVIGIGSNAVVGGISFPADAGLRPCKLSRSIVGMP